MDDQPTNRNQPSLIYPSRSTRTRCANGSGGQWIQPEDPRALGERSKPARLRRVREHSVALWRRLSEGAPVWLGAGRAGRVLELERLCDQLPAAAGGRKWRRLGGATAVRIQQFGCGQERHQVSGGSAAAAAGEQALAGRPLYGRAHRDNLAPD